MSSINLLAQLLTLNSYKNSWKLAIVEELTQQN